MICFPKMIGVDSRLSLVNLFLHWHIDVFLRIIGIGKSVQSNCTFFEAFLIGFCCVVHSMEGISVFPNRSF
jgi:hypothetical protein